MAMRSMTWTLVCVCLFFVLGWGKPYQTPLIGNIGGKRTLVVLDDMVRIEIHPYGLLLFVWYATGFIFVEIFSHFVC
jgi:hypothetical protein